MLLINALKKKGRPYEIPDCSRDDLPAFFKKMGFKRGVEVGVYKAEFTKKFCEAGLEIIGVDPWQAYGDYKEAYTKHKQNQDRQDFLYEHSMNTMSKCSGDWSFIRKTSMDAVKDFEDNSIDFVYIDGHNGFKYIAEHLWEWSKKVKPGGVISGHDYARTKDARDKYTYHVKFVIDAYTQARNIKNFYVLGRKETIRGWRRDKWRSWMWIKK